MPKLTPMRLGRLNLRPDDILVLMSDGPITQETAHRLKEQFERKPLGFKNKVIVLSDGLKLGKISRKKKSNVSGSLRRQRK